MYKAFAYRVLEKKRKQRNRNKNAKKSIPPIRSIGI